MGFFTTLIFTFWLVVFIKASENIVFDSDVGTFASEEVTINLLTNQNIIPITKCCGKKILYRTASDECGFIDSTINTTSQLKGETVKLFFKVRSSRDKNKNRNFQSPSTTANNNHVISSNILFYANSTRMIDCPQRYKSYSTKHFKIFGNGILKTPDGGVLNLDEYCINEDEEEHKPNTPALYVARFCIPDPCANGTKCIRKCCSPGFALSSAPNFVCRKHSVPFNASLLRSQSGKPLDARAFDITRKYPRCGNVGLEQVELGSFFILPDGRMNLGGPVEQYCVDNLLDDDNIYDTVVGN